MSEFFNDVTEAQNTVALSELEWILRDYIELGVRTVVKEAGLEKWRNTPIPDCDGKTPNELMAAGRWLDLAKRIRSYRDLSFT